MSKPNFFQRRWEWHSRVVDFEKKYEKIHPPRLPHAQVLEIFATLKVPETKCRGGGGNGDNNENYKNRIFMSTVICGGDKIYLVTLKLDDGDGLYDDVEETKEFDTEADALRCFHTMIQFKNMLPQSAHRIFLDYGK
jgi:hypothetical protein